MYPKIPIRRNENAGWVFELTTYGEFGLRRVVARNRMMPFLLWIDEQADHTWESRGCGNPLRGCSKSAVRRWTDRAKEFTRFLFGWNVDDDFDSWIPNTMGDGRWKS